MNKCEIVDGNKIFFKCPHCGESTRPLRSKNTVSMEDGRVITFDEWMIEGMTNGKLQSIKGIACGNKKCRRYLKATSKTGSDLWVAA